MKQIEIENIVAANTWLDLEAKVLELWEPSSDKISQVGLLQDRTGIVKFVNFTTSSCPKLEPGTRYLFKNVVSNEYNGRFSVTLTKKSKVTPVGE